MATDYDAPRKNDDELNEDSIEELKARRTGQELGRRRRGRDGGGRGFELPGADLSNEELSVRVLPRQQDEFTCTAASSWCTAASCTTPATAGSSATTAPPDPGGQALRTPGRHHPVGGGVGRVVQVDPHGGSDPGPDREVGPGVEPGPQRGPALPAGDDVHPGDHGQRQRRPSDRNSVSVSRVVHDRLSSTPTASTAPTTAPTMAPCVPQIGSATSAPPTTAGSQDNHDVTAGHHVSRPSQAVSPLAGRSDGCGDGEGLVALDTSPGSHAGAARLTGR